MTDTIYALGDLDFLDGSFTTEYVAYVLGNVLPIEPTLDFIKGTSKVYDLGPVYLFGAPTEFQMTNGHVLLTSDPLGAFEDFAIFAEGEPDPVNGFVLADTSGNLSGGSTDPWTRHYRVAYPPKKAQYVVPHIKLGSVAAGKAQYIDANQLEVLTVGSTAPSAFDSARSIKVNVRPNRLNYATGSTHVPFLIPGRTYIASADGDEGQRVWYTFVAQSESIDLVWAGATNPKRILVEEGSILGAYFDGNSGDDYLWEQGGTPGAARSYYYADRAARHYVLVRTLQENVALGVTVEDPQYATLRTSGGYGRGAYGVGIYG